MDIFMSQTCENRPFPQYQTDDKSLNMFVNNACKCQSARHLKAPRGLHLKGQQNVIDRPRW